MSITPKANKIQNIKLAPPPTDLPMIGEVNPKEVSFIGRTNYVAALEEKRYIFGIKRADRKRHVYIIGKSGVGKSKMHELLIRQDIAHGFGVCVIDPYGDLVEELLNFIPEDRIQDVCVIDVVDEHGTTAFNPFYNIGNKEKHQFTQGFIDVMRKHFGLNFNSSLEHLLRFSLLAVLDHPHCSLESIVYLLTNQEYREQIIPYIEDPMIKRFWEYEFIEWSSKFEAESVVPLVNKLGQILADPIMKKFLSNTENKIDFNNCINTNKIVLVNLAKSHIGEENSSFLGSLIINKIRQASLHKNHKNGTGFYIYIDEFQNFITDSFENFLLESKKYNIHFTLTHQYMNQLSSKIQQALLGNIGTIICFRVGSDDAAKLKPEFSPIFEVKDMINLGIGEFYIKMTIEGETYDPFSAEALKILPPTHDSYKDIILHESRKKYSVL